MTKKTRDEVVIGIFTLILSPLVLYIFFMLLDDFGIIGPVIVLLLGFFIPPLAFLFITSPTPKHFFRFTIISYIYYFAINAIMTALGPETWLISDFFYLSLAYVIVAAICGSILYYIQTVYFRRKSIMTTDVNKDGAKTQLEFNFSDPTEKNISETSEEQITNVAPTDLSSQDTPVDSKTHKKIAEGQLELNISNSPEKLASEKVTNETLVEIDSNDILADNNAKFKKSTKSTYALLIILIVVIAVAIIASVISYNVGYEKGSTDGYEDGYEQGESDGWDKGYNARKYLYEGIYGI